MKFLQYNCSFYNTKGRVFDACVRRIVLYGGETWADKANDLNRLERNDMMVRWMCKVSLKERKTSKSYENNVV